MVWKKNIFIIFLTICAIKTIIASDNSRPVPSTVEATLWADHLKTCFTPLSCASRSQSLASIQDLDNDEDEEAADVMYASISFENSQILTPKNKLPLFIFTTHMPLQLISNKSNLNLTPAQLPAIEPPIQLPKPPAGQLVETITPTHTTQKARTIGRFTVVETSSPTSPTSATPKATLLQTCASQAQLINSYQSPEAITTGPVRKKTLE